MEKFRIKLRDGNWQLGVFCAFLSMVFVRVLAFVADFDVYQEGHYIPTMFIEILVSIGIAITLFPWVHKEAFEKLKDD